MSYLLEERVAAGSYWRNFERTTHFSLRPSDKLEIDLGALKPVLHIFFIKSCPKGARIRIDYILWKLQ